MEIFDTNIEGAYIIRTAVFNDDRGAFQKIFNYDLFDKNNMSTDFKEYYFSRSNKNVIRGLHFQVPPYDYNKIVCVSYGCILDVLLDLRKMSPTFGRIFSKRLDCESGEFVYIPKGVAHGFKSLENGTIVNYAQTSCYSKAHDMGVLFNSIKFDWGDGKPVVSGRDMAFASFEEFTKRNPF
ncbi:MAG: dTDP-4-dehydrorhamnose 3,5-epimerase family protein [Elusimicrobiales bacterium]|jgi:dTDP-4-dehydrorhamnose 3,5-epimerase